ncbi:MAG: MOSC domain-containing protein [Saprospiraceae bacterium]|nr:MOSC domain-containing protein [Saprospiraceae bacterium]
MAENIKDLMEMHPRNGMVEWIGVRSAKKIPLSSQESAQISKEEGVSGDHYHGSNKKRQVTMIQAEHLEAVAKFLDNQNIDPKLTRRNIVISGINLLSLVDKQIQIGEEVILFITGHCHPCSRMEENLGPGGYNAMRGHGGITATVVKGGQIQVGDPVAVVATVDVVTGPN